MCDCTCYNLDDKLKEAEMDVKEAKKEVGRCELILSNEEYFLGELKEALKDAKSKKDKEDIEDAIEQLKETISNNTEELDEWRMELQKRKEEYDKIKDQLEYCYSELTICSACTEDFRDIDKCGRECWCERWYCNNCFDGGIEEKEMAAGEAF